MPRRRLLTSRLYPPAPMSNPMSAVVSGKPKPVVTRAKNILIVLTLGGRLSGGGCGGERDRADQACRSPPEFTLM
jgi:hypothetical protein